MITWDELQQVKETAAEAKRAYAEKTKLYLEEMLAGTLLADKVRIKAGKHQGVVGALRIQKGQYDFVPYEIVFVSFKKDGSLSQTPIRSGLDTYWADEKLATKLMNSFEPVDQPWKQ